MHHATPVAGLQRVEKIPADPCALGKRERAATQAVGERLAHQMRHDVVIQAGPRTYVEHRHDVGVAQVREDVRFPEEALGGVCARELGPDDLDGDGAVEPRVAAEEDHAHAAAPQLPHDVVFGRQRCAEAIEQGGHGGCGRM